MKKTKTKNWLYPLMMGIFLLLISNSSYSQIYVNNFTGVSACPTNGNTPTMAGNSTGTPVTRNTIACNATANVFSSNTLNATATVNAASYIQFAATANAGFRLNLTTLSFFRQGSNSAPNQLELRYSTDGFATSTSFTAANTPTAGTVLTWDFADFSTPTAGTVTFRLYPYGTQRCDLGSPALAAGTFRVDDVTINGTVTAAPLITPSVASLTGLDYTFSFGPSTSQSFTFTGSNLTGAPGSITVNAAAIDYEVSTDNVNFFPSVTYSYASATLASQTVHVRLKAGLAVATYNSQSISISGGGASNSMTASGAVVPATPVLTMSTAALTGFNYIFGFGPSTPTQSFTVTGSNLVPASSNVSVDAGVTAYEVSVDNVNFFSSVPLAYTSGNLATTTVYIRLKASQAVANYNLQTINATAGATNTSLTASGSVSPQIPLITVSALTPTNIFTTNNPTPSAISTFTVTGAFLTDPLTISALAGYEYSDNGGFTWNSSLTYITITVNKTISVRLIGSPANTYNGTITVESLNATNSPATISVTGTVILVPLLTEVIVPQFFKGSSSTSRLPYVFRVTITNLSPNRTYRYFNGAVEAADLATVNGAGNPIFMNAPTWVHSNSVSLSTAGGYGEFDSDASGNYTGWFGLNGSGNARFTTGNNISMRIMLNDGLGGTTVVNRVTTTSAIKCLDLSTSAGINNGTGIRSVSNALAKDFVFLWDNEFGTGRPLSGTYFESDGVTNTSASGFYASPNVDGVAKAWGTVIPNTNPNGIRFISSYSRTTGSQLCTYSDADGVWPTGNINTVNPTGGNTTPLVLSATDVPLQCFLLPYANISANLATGTEAASTVITLTATLTGTIATPQTVDVVVSGLNIAGTDYTLSAATLTYSAGTNPTATATFTVFNDVLFEGIETATITIINPSAGIELGFSSTLDIDIIDNEVPKMVINEIMYNSIGADEEWVELYNNDNVNVTVDETWSITGTPSSGGPWTRLFPMGTLITLAPGQYITVQLGSAGAFPFVPSIVLSTTPDQVSNGGAPLILKINGATIDNVTYSPVSFTPAANGSGPSLSLNNPSFDNALAASWGACKIGGTPNLVNFNCDAPIFYSILSGDMNPEAFTASTAIWSTTPNGSIGLCPSFTSTRNFVIQNGNTVVLNYLATVPSINNLTVNAGGKLFSNINTSGSEKYIRLFGNVTNNGVIGNGVTYDAIGLSIEGINSTLSGAGSYNLGRIRKDLTTNIASTVTINANVNLRFPGAGFYNNIATTTLNLTLNAGRFLTFTDPTGDLSMDGVDGTGSGDRNGNIIINGILNVADKIFALTNNIPAKSCNITVGSTGRIEVANIDANVDGTGGTLGAFSFTLNTGGKINLTGRLKVLSGNLNSNGGLVIKSTATQTALIDGSSVGNVIGDVLVERKIGALSGYHYLSSPVSGAFVNNTVSGWRDDFTILSSVDNLAFIPGNIYNVIPTVFEYDETNLNPNSSFGFIGATGTTDPITPLKGFACVVPANTTVDAFGPVNNGPVNYTVTKASDGINLIGNPYPSPINWTLFRAHNTNLDVTYQAFKTTGGYAGSYGEYNSLTSLGTNGVGNIIASSQAFLVTANTAGAIQALNADRTLDLNPTYFNQPAIVNDVLRLELVKDGSQDEIIIFFAPAIATDNFDALTDAKKMFPFNTDHSFVYSIAGNDKLAMNGLGTFATDKMIPLGINAFAAGSHQIVATDLSNFAPSAMIYLYDAQTGTVQNLRSNPTYTINLAAGTHEGRFFIQFTPAVQLNTSAATCQSNDGQVTLTYNSAAVLNVTIKNQSGNIVSNLNNFNGQQIVNNLPFGNYEVNYLHTNGYASVEYFTIAGVTPVSLQANASATQLLVGENVNFTSISSTNNTVWNFGDGVVTSGNDVNHIFNSNGNFIVTASTTNGECSQSIEIPVNVSAATGIESNNAQNIQWLLANNQLTIKFADAMTANTNVDLFDLSGKLIYSSSIAKGQTQHTIPTAKFAEGIYVAKLLLNNGITVKKIAIRK